MIECSILVTFRQTKFVFLLFLLSVKYHHSLKVNKPLYDMSCVLLADSASGLNCMNWKWMIRCLFSSVASLGLGRECEHSLMCAVWPLTENSGGVRGGVADGGPSVLSAELGVETGNRQCFSKMYATSNPLYLGPFAFLRAFGPRKLLPRAQNI